MKKCTLSKTTRNNFEYLAFLFLPLLIFIYFMIIPNLSIFYYSLLNWDGISPEKTFVGLSNYIFLFTRETAMLIGIKNTIVYTITVVVFQNVIGLILAILITKQNIINKFLRTTYFLPMVFSSVTIGFIWGFIYDPNLGILNAILRGIGLEDLIRVWLANQKTVMFSISAVHIWVSIGFSMMIFITGLKNIPYELYESADIEGARSWSKFVRITLPLLRPATIIALVITTIGCFKAFDLIFVMTGGGADGSSEVIATLLFKEGFYYSRIGYSTAMSVVLMMIIMIVTFVQLHILKDRG